MFDTQLRLASVFPRARSIDQVGAQAVGRAQARSLADQHQRQLCAKQLANLILQRHAAETSDDDRRESAIRRGSVAAAARPARGRLPMDRQRRQSVAARRSPGRRRLEPVAVCCNAYRDGSSSRRPKSGRWRNVLPIRGCAVDDHDLDAERAQFRRPSLLGVERIVHRIAGRGMGRFEFKPLRASANCRRHGPAQCGPASRCASDSHGSGVTGFVLLSISTLLRQLVAGFGREYAP